MVSIPSDFFLEKLQFTKKQHLDLYSAVDPTNAKLSRAGKVAIITGASRGLGAEGIVPAFAKAGISGIVLVATNAEKLEAVEADLNSRYPLIKALSIPVDISDEAAVQKLFDITESKFGHADILVNNAAVSCGGSDIHDENPKQWWRNFEVNVKGTFLITQHFLRCFPSTSAPASIINIISNAAWEVYPNASGYSISKLALLQLTAHTASAYPNITSVAVHPGFVKTDMLYDAFQHMKLSSPELVGGVVVWLTTEFGRFLSGRVVCANWDVPELQQKEVDIKREGLLRVDLLGSFGRQHFE